MIFILRKLPVLLLALSCIHQQPLSAQEEPTEPLSLAGLESYHPDQLRYNGDWLVHTPKIPSGIFRSGSNCIVLSNGLISRTFTVAPDGATVGFDNLITGVSHFRALKPEATVTIAGQKVRIGGLTGQPVMNYFKTAWLEHLQPDEFAMHLVGFTSNAIRPPFEWKKRYDWMPEDPIWPPAGLELVMVYRFEESAVSTLLKTYDAEFINKLIQVEVEVHYELYDGLPLLSKWIEIKNHGTDIIRIDDFESEILAYVEPESVVGDKDIWRPPLFTVETNYAFGGSMSQEASMGNSYEYCADEAYETVINYNRIQPTMLVVSPRIGPGIELGPNQSFESYRVYELIHDNTDRERQGLAVRKMYRTLTPWATENPILMHVRRADNNSVRTAIDQCADVGFEMVIMTFGSGFNIEDSSRKNLDRLKSLGDYAHMKGIALGGYSLLASRTIDPDNDVVLPEGQSPRFGHSPCLQSSWGRNYFRNLYAFYDYTGLDILEHDGSYPGDMCVSTHHPGHRDVHDSQWNQFQMISEFYRWCRSRGIYLNVPDWYFMNGSNKTAMGYRETNWSLPREFQEIIERQNIYDGTWEKTPSMGWMFVPLVQYHGGGKEATIEPLKDHLDHYEQRLANLFGAGVQACYRGPRLYDAPETRDIVKKWVDFYKRHRQILDADIIHIRRPDGKDFDGILHADPEGEEKGLLMLYNPLDHSIEKDIEVDLYYTGLRGEVIVTQEDGPQHSHAVPDSGKIEIKIQIPAKKWTWYVFK